MEPISLILGALLMGATKGVGEAAGTAIQDAYVGLRDAVKRKLAGKPAAESAVEEYTAGSSSGKYNVDLRGAQGVQVGDRNAQTNYFGSTS